MLAGAKKTLDSANNFTKSVTGGKPNAFAPKPGAAASSASKYAPVREARKSPGEFMGISSDQGAELKSAEAARAQAKEALNNQ